MKAVLTLALCAGLLAGCDSTVYPLSPVAIATPATGPVNGIFYGRSTLVDAKDDTCPPEAHGLIQIGDGRLLYPYSTHVTFAAAVGPDGRLSDTDEQSSLVGMLADGELTFTVKTPACESSFAFTRVSGF